MKNILKVLSVVLIVCMLLGVFAACNNPADESSSPEQPQPETSGDSKALDNYLLEQDGTTVSKDFTLPKTIGGNDAVWTSDNEAVKMEQRDEDWLASIQFPDSTQEVHLTVKAGGAEKTFTVRVNALDVYTFLDNYAFPQDKQVVTSNFPLDSEYEFKGRKATIVWSVDEEYADYLAVSEDGKECIVYGSSLNPQVRIKGTFTYNGESAPKTYRLTVGLPMNDLEKIDNWYNTTGLTQTISGYVVAKGPWTNYNGTYEAILYVIDDSLKAGYYLYNEPTDIDEATYATLQPGTHITCENPVNADYNGLMETSNYKGRTTIDADIDPIDITPYALDNDLLGGVPALRYRQSTLVSLTDWKVKSVNAKLAEKSPTTLLTLEKNGVEISVQITKYFYDYAHDAKDPVVQEILKKTAAVKAGDWVSVEGILGWYKAPQISLLSPDGIKAGQKDSASSFPGTKVADVIKKNAQTLADAGADKLITTKKEFTLIDKEGDVNVKFELCSASSAVKLEGGKFSVDPGKAEKVHVQCTYSCGDYETVVFFYIDSVAKDNAEKVKEEAEKYTIDDRNAGVSEIRTAPLTYEDVVLTFSVPDEFKSLVSVTNKGAMTLQPVAEKTQVALRVTATCGDQTASKDVPFSILVSTFTAYDVVTKPEEGKEYKLGFDNGVVHLATGAMSGYYGVTSTKAEEGVPAYAEKSGKGYNIYVLIGSKQEKKYVNMTVSGEHVNYTYDDKASTAWNIDGKGCLTTVDDAKAAVWVGTRGTFETIGAYRDSAYAMNKDDSYPLHLYTVSVDDATPAERAKAEINLISIPASVTEDLELPTEYKKYYDVTISWSMKTKDTDQRLKNGKLVVRRSNEDEEVELVATAKCGSAKKSKTFTVKVMALPSLKTVSEIYDIGSGLDDRQITDAEYECIGIVSEIATEYSKDYENISVWMTDGNTEKNVEGYRIKGSSASKLKVGDVITVSGKVQNYGGTIEFVAGSVIKEYVPATFKTVSELSAAAKSANPDQKTVFSTYGTVSEVTDNLIVLSDGKESLSVVKLSGVSSDLSAIASGDIVACYGKLATVSGTTGLDATLVSVATLTEKTDADKANEELKLYKIDDQKPGSFDLPATPRKYSEVTFSFAVEDAASKKLVTLNGSRAKLEPVDKDTEVVLKVTATCGKDSVSADRKFKILATEFTKYTPVVDPVKGTAYKLGFDNGKQVMLLNGEMSGYYAVTTTKADEGVDAYAESVTGGYRVYVMIGKDKKYVNCTVSDTHFNFTYDDKASTVWEIETGFKTKANDAFVWAGSRGTYTTVGCYNESAYASSADTSYPLFLFNAEKDESTAKERAQAELFLIELPASINKDLDLPDLYQKYYDVELSWALKEAVEGQKVVDGKKLQITRGDQPVAVVLVCTATCGKEKETREFDVTIEGNATVANVNTIYNAGMALENGAFLDGQYECTAIVESIATAYNSQYGNISVWLVDGPPVKIEAYRLSGEGVDTLKAGDVVTVVGKVKKYVKGDDVTIEFDSGCTLKSKVEATFKTVTELYENGKSGSQDKTTVFSTYGKVTKIVNPISGTFTTCNIFITDGKNEIECYKLGGDVDQLKNVKEGDYVSCYGKMTTYGETVEFNGCTLIGLTGDYVVSADQIPEEEANGYKLNDQYAGEWDLPTTPKYEGTTFSFEITDSETKKYATLNGTKITFIPVDEATTLKLNVTATNGGKSATAECVFKLVPSVFTKVEAVTALEAGKTYMIGFDKNGFTYLATGTMSGYYGVTDTDANKAVEAQVEQSGSGWNLFVTVDGAKKYVNCTVSGTYLNYTYDDAASTAWLYDKGYFYVVVDGEEAWAGTRGTYTTIGVYKETANAAASNQPLKAYVVTIDNSTTAERAQAELDLIELPKKTSANVDLPVTFKKYNDVQLSWALKAPVTGQSIADGNKLTVTQGDSDVNVVLVCTAKCGLETATKEFTITVSGKTATYSVAATLKAGTAYKLGFDKSGTVYYANGAMSGYYGAAVTDIADAVDAYAEASGSGWHLYAMISGAKKYINCTVSGTHLNYTYDDAASTVWSYAKGYFTATVDGEEVWTGTRGTYTTISIYKESASAASGGQPLRAYAKNA